MRRWWNDKDVLDVRGEKSITIEDSLKESVEMICQDVRNARRGNGI